MTTGADFISPLFGPTRQPFEHESAELKKLAEYVPVAMFQALNRALNERGLMLSITKLPEGGAT